MKYRITLWVDENVDELLDALEEVLDINNVDFSLEKVQDNKEEL